MAVFSGKGACVLINGARVGSVVSFDLEGTSSRGAQFTPQVLADARKSIDAMANAEVYFKVELSSEQKVLLDSMNETFQKRNKIAAAAKTRSARWKVGDYGTCVRCGGPTRARYLDDEHRHMACLDD